MRLESPADSAFRGLPKATIIFEFLYCASAQGEDSKEKKGCGEKEGRKKNPLGEF